MLFNMANLFDLDVGERQDYHLIHDLWFSYKILKFSEFLLEVFLSTSFSAPVSVWLRLLRNE